MLEQLYKEVILEHYKRPRNRGELANATVREEGLNPSCGDELELFLIVEQGKIVDIKFLGEGCAVSQSSASMMSEVVKGKTSEEVFAVSEKFRAMLQGEPPSADLGELAMLQGVSKLHARVKCAALPWVTLERALERSV